MNQFVKYAILMGLTGGVIFGFTQCRHEPPAPAPKVIDTGRPETRSIEAADGLGYNGKAIRKQVDAALNAQDQTGQRIDKQVADQQGPADQPAP
jgi:hypothetical protein